MRSVYQQEDEDVTIMPPNSGGLGPICPLPGMGQLIPSPEKPIVCSTKRSNMFPAGAILMRTRSVDWEESRKRSRRGVHSERQSTSEKVDEVEVERDVIDLRSGHGV